MPDRRILSLWFPRLGAERLIRRQPVLGEQPLAVVAEQANMQVIASLNGVAQAARPSAATATNSPEDRRRPFERLWVDFCGRGFISR